MPKFPSFMPCGLALLLALPAFSCVAQTLPDAGRLLRESERNPSAPLPARPPVEAARPTASAAATGKTVQVRRFVFEGNVHVSSAELESALRPFQDQWLDFSTLQRAADAATDTYRRAGWLARAVLKAQDITDGQVTITIQEARFGTVRAQVSPGSRVPAGKVMAIFGTHLTAGDPFSLDTLERAIGLASELAGVEIRVNLAEGQATGQTDLVVEMQDGPRATLDPALDNGGSRATGNARVSAGLGLANLLGQGESLRVDTTASQGIVADELAGLLASGVDRAVAVDRTINKAVAADAARSVFPTQAAEAVRTAEREVLANLFLQRRTQELMQGVDDAQIAAYYASKVHDDDYASFSLRYYLTRDAADAHSVKALLDSGDRAAQARLSPLMANGQRQLSPQAVPYGLGQIVRKAKPADVLGPLLVRDGYLLLVLDERRDGKKPALADVKNDIRAVIADQRLGDELRDWRQKARIELR